METCVLSESVAVVNLRIVALLAVNKFKLFESRNFIHRSSWKVYDTMIQWLSQFLRWSKGGHNMFHKIRNVAATEDFVLIVQFSEGVTKRYYLIPLFDKIPAFRALQQSADLYYSVEVDVGGYGIIWNDDLDLSCDELWDNGETVKTEFDGMLSFGEATSLWGLNESTLRKAVAHGKLKNGIDVQKFGKQWVILKSAMIREYGDKAS